MESLSLTQITKQFDIQDIEKHLVFYFLSYNNIAYSKSALVTEYLDGFVPNSILDSYIQTLNHNTIEDIAVDMELLIPSEDKKVNGAFFTPAYIVDYIINHINPNCNAKIIDISCGSGAFLLGIVRFITKKFNKSVADCIRKNVYGADILDYNIKRSKLLLSLMALEKGEIVESQDMNLLCCDSLKYNWTVDFDAVVGNPPYVKFQDMDDDTRNFLLNNFETTKFGTFNLYFAFFEVGLKILTKEGKLGYITPNNYFTSLSGECLRAYFQREKCISDIIDFNATKVFDVQTYTAIAFLNRNKNSKILYSRIENTQNPIEYLSNVSLTSNLYDDLVDKKWRLLCGNERYNIMNIENCGEPIGNMFNICAGIATLKDELYFINYTKENKDFYYIVRDNIEFQIEKDITRPLVKISDMKKIEDIKSNKRKIIFPYKRKNGKIVAIPEETMQDKYPKCYEYFTYVKDILKGRGKAKHIYTPFYAYGRTQGLNRTGIKLLTPTFSKTPRFLLDENELGFFTNGYGVYLRAQKDSLFDTELIAQPENLDVVQKILNSIVMEYYVDKTSVAIEGGYPCYQKNFIEQFSIPSMSKEEIYQLRSLNTPKQINEFLISKYHLKLSFPNRCS